MTPGSAVLVQPGDGPGADLSGHVAELTAALAEAGNRMAVAERDRAVSLREVELLRERMAELREELVASKADRERLLALVETQARVLVDLRERPSPPADARGASSVVGVVERARRWLFGDRGMAQG